MQLTRYPFYSAEIFFEKRMRRWHICLNLPKSIQHSRFDLSSKLDNIILLLVVNCHSHANPKDDVLWVGIEPGTTIQQTNTLAI